MLISTPLVAATFRASLDRTTIALGESATLGLQFEGGTPRSIPIPPNVDGLEVRYVGPSSQVVIVNGQTTSTTTYNFSVHPLRAGDFTLPALRAEVKGQTLVSQPIRLRVVRAAAAASSGQDPASSLAFLRLVLPKDKVFVGEVIVAELQLLLHSQVVNAHDLDVPSLGGDGFNASQPVQGEQRRMQVGSRIYNVVPFYIPITATRAGELKIGPVNVSLIVEVRSNRRRNGPFSDLFDMGFPSMFGGTQAQRVALTLKVHTIEAVALPTENVPKAFNGAVGQFNMAVTAGPTNIAVGDPITVKVRIDGRGTLSSIQLPEDPGWRDFKSYPPTTDLETENQLGVQGTKTFEQVVVPENAEIKELPPITFAYFDPETAAYKTLRHPATPLRIRPTAATPAPTVSAQPAAPGQSPPREDIVHIKPRLGELTTVGTATALKPGFLVLNALPPLLWLAAWGWRKRGESLASNPRLRRHREVERAIRKGLQDLRGHADSRDSDAFFVTLFRLLQEQIGDSLDQPASGITEAAVDDKLRPLGLTDDLASEVHELFQACNLARYAPIQSRQELAAFIPRLETALGRLKEVRR